MDGRAVVLFLAAMFGAAAAGAEPVDWKQRLFPRALFAPQTADLNGALREAYVERAGSTPAPASFNFEFVRDARGVLLGAVTQDRISYKQSYFVLALGLNTLSRIEKVFILDIGPEVHADIVDAAPNGIVTRYTAISVRQLRLIAQSLQARDDVGALLANEVLRRAALLDALLAAERTRDHVLFK